MCRLVNSSIETIPVHRKRVKPSGRSKWTAKCPSHDESGQSLSVSEDSQGKVLLHCHAGCKTDAVMAALGLKMKDLFPEDGESTHKRQIAETYDYTDEAGKLLYQVVRYTPKDFRQRKPDGAGGWIPNLMDTRRALYRLPQVLEQVNKGGWVFIVEGEKDADALTQLGLVATCNAGGAGKWLDSYSESLKGAQVAILPDNDSPGRKHAETVAAALKGIAADVRVIHLPGLPEKGDMSDWVAAGGTVDNLKKIITAPPVGLASLLDRIAEFVSDYVVFAKPAQLHAVVLWIMHTHLIDQFEATPYLNVKSPEKGSGKTRVYEVAELLVRNSWRCVNPSEAVFYRKIEAHNPTMLLDEVDAIWNHTTASQHEGLRAGINAGYRRGVTVDRCAGQKGDKLVSFPVFCAKSLAGIGKLPDTSADRSRPNERGRKTKQEEDKRYS